MNRPLSQAVRTHADFRRSERIRSARIRTKAEATGTDDNSPVLLRATKPHGLWSACQNRTRRLMIERMARRAARSLKSAGRTRITPRKTR
jgi:hypothetical protein